MKNTKNGENTLERYFGKIVVKGIGKGENTEKSEKILGKSGKILRIQQKLRKFGGKRTPKIMENTKKIEKILQKIRKDTPPKPKIRNQYHFSNYDKMAGL